MTLLTCCGCTGTSGRSTKDEILDTDISISKMIDHWAQQLDLYLANDKYVEVPNKSRLTVYNAFTFEEGGHHRYSPHIGVKLHLPNLQEKLALNFTNYDEDRLNRGINENRYQTTPSEKTYTTSLSLIQDLGNVKTEFRPLLEFSDRLETSYLFRFYSEAKRGAFSIEPELQLFARSDAGTGEFFGLNFGLDMTDDDHLKIVNEEQYTDGDNTLSTNHGFIWKHAYNKVMAQETGWIFESDNRTTYHLQEYVVSSTFSHKFYVDILHYSITPYVRYQQPRIHKPVAALDLKFEVIF